MQVNDNTRLITINGAEYRVPQPFSEGHTCSAGEAHALNQTLAENIRNNMASKLKKGLEGDAQQYIDDYVKDYEFALPGERQRSAPTDPIEAEAYSAAKKRVVAQLKSKGHKIADIPEEQLDTLVTQVLAKYPEFRIKAAEFVEAKRKAAEAYSSISVD